MILQSSLITLVIIIIQTSKEKVPSQANSNKANNSKDRCQIFTDNEKTPAVGCVVSPSKSVCDADMSSCMFAHVRDVRLRQSLLVQVICLSSVFFILGLGLRIRQ